MDDLPPSRQLSIKDAYYMILIKGLESVTRALRMGDGFDSSIQTLAMRCRALADAYDARVAHNTSKENDK